MRYPSKTKDFTALTIKHTGLANRIISDVAIFPAFDPANPPNPPIPAFMTKALWDTGATGSVLTKVTASSMKLIPSGKTLVNHAAGQTESNTYLVNFGLPNSVLIAGIQATEGDIVGSDFGAIIGMDIISLGDFSITNFNGISWMSFRFPSVEAIDYVDDYNKKIFANIGKNHPCPCGSGKKFKLCHGSATPPI